MNDLSFGSVAVADLLLSTARSRVGAVVVVRQGLTYFNFQKDKLCEDSKYDDTG